jgi:hypothetical protein
VIADFPDGITPGISYGHNVESLAAYMSVRQFLPFRRMAELFQYVFNLPISEGALANAIKRITEKALPAYELIRTRAENSRTNGGDETGTKINGKKGWFWTFQGLLFTYIIPRTIAVYKQSTTTSRKALLFLFWFMIVGSRTLTFQFSLTRYVWLICSGSSIMSSNVTNYNGVKTLNNFFLKPLPLRKPSCQRITTNHYVKERNLKIVFQCYLNIPSIKNIRLRSVCKKGLLNIEAMSLLFYTIIMFRLTTMVLSERSGM